jgi:hypothetical protein
MPWYAASIVENTIMHGEFDNLYRLCESVILIYAKDDNEAWDKAEKAGEESAAIPEGLWWRGKEATRGEFVGVRKLTLLSNPKDVGKKEDEPGDGAELTYSYFEVVGEDELKKFVNGDEVEVLYLTKKTNGLTS